MQSGTVWTGRIFSAVATHARVQDPLFSHTLFPIYFGVLIWGGLLLRDRRLRALFPFSAARQSQQHGLTMRRAS